MSNCQLSSGYPSLSPNYSCKMRDWTFSLFIRSPGHKAMYMLWAVCHKHRGSGWSDLKKLKKNHTLNLTAFGQKLFVTVRYMSLPEQGNNIFRNNLFWRATAGAPNPNLQECYYACTACKQPASFRIPLKMIGMHRMQYNHVRLQLPSLKSCN